MNEAELKSASDLITSLRADAEAASKQLAPFVALGKLIKWLVATIVTLIMAVGGVSIWVNGVNQASAANQKAIIENQQALVAFEANQPMLFKAREQEAVARDRENRAWQVEKDVLVTKLATNQEMVLKILDRHEKFIEAHGWPGLMPSLSQPTSH